MTNLQILEAFEREINKFDDSATKPDTDASLYWLNQAVKKFVKLRYNGDPVHKTGYEETEKRYSDLANLLKTAHYYRHIWWQEKPEHVIELDTDCGNYQECYLDYPDDFLYTLSETAQISDIDEQKIKSTTKWVPVFECTADSFMYRVNNSLTDFHYNNQYARPLRVRTNKGCKLLTDGKYKVWEYILQYLRHPKEISLDKPFTEYKEFDEAVLPEIIKIAAQMYVENTADKRYTTISNEVNTQE